jgi:gamma-glutamylcyclotransferase (GGCT)/AIG2-like uncharacterized protein YtfP
MKYRVFTYGSLMNGGRFHHLLSAAIAEKKAVLIPGKWVAPHCALMVHDELPYPAMQYSRSAEIMTEGELYEVDEDVMARIRRLEGTPSLYLEAVITIRKKGMWKPRPVQVIAFIANPWTFVEKPWKFARRTRWFPKGGTSDNS